MVHGVSDKVINICQLLTHLLDTAARRASQACMRSPMGSVHVGTFQTPPNDERSNLCTLVEDTLLPSAPQSTLDLTTTLNMSQVHVWYTTAENTYIISDVNNAGVPTASLCPLSESHFSSFFHCIMLWYSTQHDNGNRDALYKLLFLLCVNIISHSPR